MEFVVCDGWQELGSKYMFLSVGFFYRSVTIFPSTIEQEVSKKASVLLGIHPHGSSVSDVSFSEV